MRLFNAFKRKPEKKKPKRQEIPARTEPRGRFETRGGR